MRRQRANQLQRLTPQQDSVKQPEDTQARPAILCKLNAWESRRVISNGTAIYGRHLSRHGPSLDCKADTIGIIALVLQRELHEGVQNALTMASTSTLTWHSGLEPSRLSVVWKVSAACSERCDAALSAKSDSASHVAIAIASGPLEEPLSHDPPATGCTPQNIALSFW